MREDIAMLTIEKLESGKYSQGRNNLQADGKYCCLGVMAEAAIECGVKISKSTQGRFTYYDSEASTHSPSTCDAMDLKNRSQAMLWTLNDIEEWDFKKIAQYIREHWKAL